MKTTNKKEIQIFQGKSGEIQFTGDLQKQTIWGNLNQIADLFGKDKSNISRHIKNIYKTGELSQEQTVAFFATVQKEGDKLVERNIEYFNLDMILSIGYRVNSSQATKFRIWANNILKEYLIKGYTINQNRLQEKGLKELENTMNLIKKSLKSGDLSKDEALGLLDIITNYTNSWLLLQNYDEDKLDKHGKTKKLNYKLESKEAFESILKLKQNLIDKKEASQLFAQLRDTGGLESIFGNLYQTFGGKELYETTEEKAANLLYFVVKDHPFSDGNKRSGAFLFILFLAKNNILFDKTGNKKINDRALVAITLLIAESNPKDKDLMTKLLINLIN
ncbi:MAG: virulence protein RhuM/Fic/DOC family protein [Candidatus Gracilibacteria bacterium]|nr:virulence protein RhuM/Fic/DOC family protein [Candidatus Gracilibacteria bacterium]